MKQPLTTLVVAAALLCSTAAAYALELPSFFSDNMMLQQQTGARIWGRAAVGSTVSVTPSWNGKSVKTVAGADGIWQLELPTPAASYQTYNIFVSDL